MINTQNDLYTLKTQIGPCIPQSDLNSTPHKPRVIINSIGISETVDAWYYQESYFGTNVILLVLTYSGSYMRGI